MKNYIYITIFLTLISCQNDDTNIDNSSFNPPDWLIGTWDNSYETAFLKTYIITNNNVILEYQNNDLLDYTEFINKSSDNTLIEHEITENKYRYTIRNKLPDGEISDYEVSFVKVSNNELKLYITIPTSMTSSTYYKRN